MQIRNAILETISPRPTRESARTLIAAGHKLAESYLNRRYRTGTFQPQFFGLSIKDLAFDCIADLFERDHAGRFVHLCTYFSGIPVRKLSEAEALGAYRRLVFGRITQRLFEQYGEEDPQLSRLIRNVKYRAGRTPGLALCRRSGELYVTGTQADRTSRPLMPAEILQFHLLNRLNGSLELPAVLSVLIEVFATETEYRAAVPVTALAQAIRFIHVAMAVPPDPELDPGSRHLETRELDRFVSESVRSVRRKMRRTYIAKGKVDQTTYRSYFLAIRDILSAQFIHEHEAPLSYHAVLSRYIRNLSQEAYAREHRCYLEYLARLSRETLFRHVSQEV